MTIRTNATLRIMGALLDRIDRGIADNLCQAVESFYIDMQVELRNEFSRLNTTDPQALDAFISKITDLKELSNMQLSCQRSGQPRGEASLYRRTGRQYVRL